MNIRTFSLVLFASAIFAGATFAQNAGDTSGAATGTNAKPSTAIQKDKKGHSEGGASPQAGGPGVAGPAGSKNGPTQKSPKTQ